MERFDTQFTNIDAFLTVLDGSAPEIPLQPEPECDLTLLGVSDGFSFVIGDINEAAGWATDDLVPLGWLAPLTEFGDAEFAGGALFAIPDELFAGVVLADM